MKKISKLYIFLSLAAVLLCTTVGSARAQNTDELGFPVDESDSFPAEDFPAPEPIANDEEIIIIDPDQNANPREDYNQSGGMNDQAGADFDGMGQPQTNNNVIPQNESGMGGAPEIVQDQNGSMPDTAILQPPQDTPPNLIQQEPNQPSNTGGRSSNTAQNPPNTASPSQNQNTAQTRQAVPELDEENLFYDAEAFIPQGELGRRSTRKLNPVNQPASRFIVVKKAASADEKSSKIVAAERAITLGRIESALEIYNSILATNKRDPEALLGRAIALQQLGMVDEAIFAYETLLDFRPKNLEARVNMLGLMAQKYPSVALRQLMDLYEDHRENTGLIAQIGITQARLNNYQEALKFMGIAISMEPENARNYYTLAVIADQGGLHKDAVRYYEKALEVDTIYEGGRSLPRDAVYTRLAQIR